MKALTLRLDDPTHERLRQQAFEQRTTITALVRDALTERPEATHTVTAEQVETVLADHPGYSLRHEDELDDWYVCTGCGVEVETSAAHVAGEFRAHQAEQIAALTVADTPTQAGDDA